MSYQLGASGNLNLWSAGACSTNLYDTLSREIKRTACIAATRAQSVLVQTYFSPYITIISIISNIICIILKLELQIWVHIYCRKLADRHIHNWVSVSKQTTSSKDSCIISIPVFSRRYDSFLTPIEIAPFHSSDPTPVLGRTYGTYLHYERTYTTNVPIV